MTDLALNIFDLKLGFGDFRAPHSKVPVLQNMECNFKGKAIKKFDWADDYPQFDLRTLDDESCVA